MKSFLLVIVLICAGLYGVSMYARSLTDDALLQCTRLWHGVYVCGDRR